MPRLPRPAAFAALVAALLALMASASAPSPVYHLYQERMGFPTWMLTLIFGVYAVVLLGTLITAGSLSDHIGRRPALIAGLVLQAGSTGLFWAADGVPSLLIARILQGVSTGIAIGAVSAAMVDLSPRRFPWLGTTLSSAGLGVGLAAGAVTVGFVGQWTPSPDQWIFPSLTALLGVLAIVMAFIPGVHPRKPGALASLWPTIGISASLRPVFARALPGIVAGWAIMGLFMALGPSIVSADFEADPTITGGYVIAILAASNAVGAVATARLTPSVGSSVGPALMVLGMAWTLFSAQLGSLPLHLVAAALAGAGAGASFTSAVRTIGAATPATHRAQTLSAIYAVSYLSLSVPALGAGIIATNAGLGTAVDAIGAFVMVVASTGAALAGIHRPAAQPAHPLPETRPISVAASH